MQPYFVVATLILRTEAKDLVGNCEKHHEQATWVLEVTFRIQCNSWFDSEYRFPREFCASGTHSQRTVELLVRARPSDRLRKSRKSSMSFHACVSPHNGCLSQYCLHCIARFMVESEILNVGLPRGRFRKGADLRASNRQQCLCRRRTCLVAV